MFLSQQISDVHAIPLMLHFELMTVHVSHMYPGPHIPVDKHVYMPVHVSADQQSNALSATDSLTPHSHEIQSAHGRPEGPSLQGSSLQGLSEEGSSRGII